MRATLDPSTGHIQVQRDDLCASLKKIQYTFEPRFSSAGLELELLHLHEFTRDEIWQEFVPGGAWYRGDLQPLPLPVPPLVIDAALAALIASPTVVCGSVTFQRRKPSAWQRSSVPI